MPQDGEPLDLLGWRSVIAASSRGGVGVYRMRLDEAERRSGWAEKAAGGADFGVVILENYRFSLKLSILVERLNSGNFTS